MASSIGASLADRAGPFPVWLWAVALGGALYGLARWRSGAGSGGTVGGGIGAAGTGSSIGMGNSVGAFRLRPQASNGINAQPGVALFPLSAMYVPTPAPVVSGGDNPWVGGYVGARLATPYDYARFGPS